MEPSRQGQAARTAPRKAGALGNAGSALGALVGLAALVAVVATPLGLREQAALGATVFLFALAIGRFAGPLARLSLVLLSATLSARYLYWRVTQTLSFEWSVDAVLGGVLFLAELYAFAMLLLGYLQSAGALPRRPVPMPKDPARWPTVDILIPTYSEPLEVVRATVLAAKSIDWPADKLRIYLLDDGRRDAFRAFAARAGVGYIVRPDNAHAKAGNLNHAMTRSRGEYVVIFDCDHVPARSFLQVTMGWFLRDPRLAMVQTPHHFYSPDPFERNLGHFKAMPNEGELFYGLIQPANDLWDGVFFCGSCAVLRRSALESVGGIAVETVTEDAHTALKLHRKGWSTAYLHVTQAGGLATESLSAHVGQRIRWARGMAQIFRLDNPFLGRGLSLLQRVSYAASMLHFFAGIPRLIFLLAPLSYLVFGLHIFNALPLLALAYWLPHLVLSIYVNSRVQGRHRRAFWSEVYDAALAYYIAIPTTIALLAPRRGKFNVTAKGGRIEAAYFDERIARPYLLLGLINLIGLGFGVWRLWSGVGELDVLVLNLVWTAHNLLILGATVAVAWEQRQVRESPRVALTVPAMVRLADGRTVRATTADLSRRGARVTVSGERALEPGDRVELSLFAGFEEHPLPAEVVRHEGGNLRLRFEPLDLEQEQALVQVLFSRADAWVGWGGARGEDKPLKALAQIASHAFAGTFGLLRGFHPHGRPAAAPAALPSISIRSEP